MTTAIPSTSKALLCQGDCIRIADDEQVYQVIGVDASHDRCWLRPWPLTREGSKVFEMSLKQVVTKVNHRPVRLD